MEWKSAVTFVTSYSFVLSSWTGFICSGQTCSHSFLTHLLPFAFAPLAMPWLTCPAVHHATALLHANFILCRTFSTVQLCDAKLKPIQHVCGQSNSRYSVRVARVQCCTQANAIPDTQCQNSTCIVQCTATMHSSCQKSCNHYCVTHFEQHVTNGIWTSSLFKVDCVLL